MCTACQGWDCKFCAHPGSDAPVRLLLSSAMPKVLGAAPSGQRRRGRRVGARVSTHAVHNRGRSRVMSCSSTVSLASTLSAAPHALSAGAQRCGRAGQRARTPPTLYWKTGRCCRMWCLTALTSVVRTCRRSPRARSAHAWRPAGAQDQRHAVGYGSQHADALPKPACSAQHARA